MKLKTLLPAILKFAKKHWRTALLLLFVLIVFKAVLSNKNYKLKKNGVACELDDECLSRKCFQGKCVAIEPVCGDQICEGTENCKTCEIDCAPCKKDNGEPCRDYRECKSSHCVRGVCRPTDPWCGDGYCDYPEDCFNCRSDCGECHWI